MFDNNPCVLSIYRSITVSPLYINLFSSLSMSINTNLLMFIKCYINLDSCS